MTAYGWIVETDHLKTPERPFEHEEGTWGPVTHVTVAVADALIKRGEGVRWEAFDDDGILYYSGRLIAPEDADEQVMISPLSEFARGAGCTLLKVYEVDGVVHEYQG